MKPRPRPAHFSAREPFDLPERLQANLERMRSAAAAPFVGVTATGTVEPDLFPLRPTGVLTGRLVQAARAFLAALVLPANKSWVSA